MVVGMLQEAGVDLHLTGQNRLEVGVHVVPARDFIWASRELGVLGNDSQFFLLGERALPLGVPSVVEFALVLGAPFGGHMMWRMGGPGRVIDEEWLVRHQCLLLSDPLDGVIGHVLGEVISLLRGSVRLYRHSVLVDRWGVLVGLPPDETVEMLEAIARTGPTVEGPHRACLPDRDLVTLAEMGRGIAIELQDLGRRRFVPRSQRVVAGGRRGDFGDPTHSHRVVVAAGQQCGPGRGTKRRGVEPGVLQPIGGKTLEVWSLARSAERRTGPEPHIV